MFAQNKLRYGFFAETADIGVEQIGQGGAADEIRGDIAAGSAQPAVGRQRQVRKRQEALGKLGPVMRGPVVVIGTHNKQPYFSLNKDKRTRLIYLGQKWVALARQYSQNYKRLLAIVEEMTILNMESLRRDAKR